MTVAVNRGDKVEAGVLSVAGLNTVAANLRWHAYVSSGIRVSGVRAPPGRPIPTWSPTLVREAVLIDALFTEDQAYQLVD
jgi:hypothetical protein